MIRHEELRYSKATIELSMKDVKNIKDIMTDLELVNNSFFSKKELELSNGDVLVFQGDEIPF